MRFRKITAFLLSLMLAVLCLNLADLSAARASTLQELIGALFSDAEETETEVPAEPDTVTISREMYERYRQFDELLELQDYVNEYFYQDVDTQKMLDMAAQGLLAGTGDSYTYFYNPEDYAALWEDDEGNYAGVGMQIQGNYQTNICTITRIFKDSPASESGVLKGDILYKVKVNAEEMKETTEVDEDGCFLINTRNLNEAVTYIRGVPGTTVDVTFLRGGEELTLTLERREIHVNQVDAMMLEDRIGYISLYEFAGDCAETFRAAVDDLKARGAEGLIIDLRDNPGGWLEAAVSISDIFLDAGEVCYLQYKDGTQEHSYLTKDGKIEMKLVILINENSASASEILSSCLKERADATLVGVQSFGKGIVQAVLGVGKRGAGMQLTIAQYFTPNGNAVHKIGVAPDIECPLPEGDIGMYEFGDLKDVQLSKALETMREKLAAE